MRGHIILSHGSDSGPDATKVSALAALAESLGWQTHRPDYRRDDDRGHAGSVAPRIARLRATIEALDAPPVLVGSSMGAFASALASLDVPVRGLFLLATPSRIPQYPRSLELAEGLPTLLVHGWRDEICPAGEIQSFAAARRLALHLIDDDHRLGDSMDMLKGQFQLFLASPGVA